MHEFRRLTNQIKLSGTRRRHGNASRISQSVDLRIEMGDDIITGWKDSVENIVFTRVYPVHLCVGAVDDEQHTIERIIGNVLRVGCAGKKIKCAERSDDVVCRSETAIGTWADFVDCTGIVVGNKNMPVEWIVREARRVIGKTQRAGRVDQRAKGVDVKQIGALMIR